MSQAPEGAVLVDTDVFSLAHVSPRRFTQESSDWRELLAGRPVAISFQTYEELRAWALHKRWGAPRVEALSALLADMPTIWPTLEVVEMSARLYAGCRDRGHPLHQKVHRADRWIAACAAVYSMPIASTDGIFDGLADLGVTRLQRSPG